MTFWDSAGNIRAPPENWRDLSAIPRLQVSHFCIMGREFDVVLNCTDFQVYDAERPSCPFVTRTRSFVQPEAEDTQ